MYNILPACVTWMLIICECVCNVQDVTLVGFVSNLVIYGAIILPCMRLWYNTSQQNTRQQSGLQQIS